MTQDEQVSRSNRGRTFWIERLGEFGALWAAVRLTGAELPQRSSARVGGLWATVGILACDLAVQHERGMRKPLVSLARHGEAWSGGFDGNGGLAR